MARAAWLIERARPLLRFYPIVVVLAIWQALVTVGPLQSRLFPTLQTIANEVSYFWTSGDYQFHAGLTVYRALVALGLAVVVGIVLGFMMARIRTFEALVEPLFSATYPIPRIALYPLLVIAFGTGDFPRMLLVFLECLYPMTINAYYGAKSVDRILIWSAQNMGADARMLFWRVVAPASLPYLFSGLRIAAPIALILTIVTEMLGGNKGLGYMIIISATSFMPARVFAAAIAIALVGFLLDRLVVLARNRVVVWERI